MKSSLTTEEKNTIMICLQLQYNRLKKRATRDGNMEAKIEMSEISELIEKLATLDMSLMIGLS